MHANLFCFCITLSLVSALLSLFRYLSRQEMVSKNVESPMHSDADVQNVATMDAFYKALICDDKEKVAKFLASDLEWWFHGPPKCQHMMRILTGESSGCNEFKFVPRNITAVDGRVIAEGWEGAQAYWVHVWTVKDGMITQFREYFNTWLTVRDLRPSQWMARHETPTIWQSRARDLAKRSMPGLVLAI